MSRSKLEGAKKNEPKVDTRGLLPRKKRKKVKVLTIEEIQKELQQKKLREKRRKQLIDKGRWHGGKGRA